jgi:uncharacterized membrane protein
MPNSELVKHVMTLTSSPATVAALLEDVSRVPEWHPILTSVRPGKKGGRGEGATIEWTAKVAGREVRGNSVATIWKSGREYAWKSTEETSGFNWVGRLSLEPKGENSTNVTIALSFNMPKTLASIAKVTGVRTLLKGNIERVLKSLNRVSRS